MVFTSGVFTEGEPIRYSLYTCEPEPVPTGSTGTNWPSKLNFFRTSRLWMRLDIANYPTTTTHYYISSSHINFSTLGKQRSKESRASFVRPKAHKCCDGSRLGYGRTRWCGEPAKLPRTVRRRFLLSPFSFPSTRAPPLSRTCARSIHRASFPSPFLRVFFVLPFSALRSSESVRSRREASFVSLLAVARPLFPSRSEFKSTRRGVGVSWGTQWPPVAYLGS